MVSTAAFHARVRGSVPGLGGSKETKMFLPHPRVKVSIVGSLRDREVACSASDRQDSNFESRVWRTVSSQSSHHPQEVLLAQLSLYVHKGGLKPDSFHFIFFNFTRTPFGLRNSGQTFQRFIDHITRGLDFVFVYFNNLLVTSVDHKTHKNIYKLCLLAEYGIIIISPEKCQFGTTELSFLGHHVCQEGISPLPTSADAIVNFVKP